MAKKKTAARRSPPRQPKPAPKPSPRAARSGAGTVGGTLPGIGGKPATNPAALAATAPADAAVLSPTAIEVAERAHRQAAIRERERRINDYDAAVSAWPTTRRPGAPLTFGAAGDKRPPLRILAEGDSWFDFPFGGKPFRGGDVIERLRDIIPFPILNLAVRGDEVRSMLGCAQRQRLRQLLEDPGRDFNVLLFSGGGNDIVGDPFRLWLRDRAISGGDPARALNDAAIGCILQVVRTAYEDLFDLRDQIVARTPGRSITVFCHGYDWAIPSGNGVCGFGPWLKPSLEDRGWRQPAEARAIVKEALSRFADLLEDISRQYADVVVVRTQGTLGPTEWNDELHPNREGFPKIAAKFREALKVKFPALVK